MNVHPSIPVGQANIVITLSPVQIKALYTELNEAEVSIEYWINNFVTNRASQIIDKLFNEEVNRLVSNGLPVSGTKDDIVLNAPVKSAKEINNQNKQNAILF